MPTPEPAPLQWSALDCVLRVAAGHFERDRATLTGLTRVDELAPGDELLVIAFIAAIEVECGCDIPDYEITTTATLAQLAGLVERHRVKE